MNEFASTSTELDAMHRRWLELTENGSAEFIMTRFNQQIASGNPNLEACVRLVAGYIAQIGIEHITPERDEEAVCVSGKQVVMRCVERWAAEPEAKTLEVEDVMSEIAAALEVKPDDASHEEEIARSTPKGHSKERKIDALEKANRRRVLGAGIKAGLREEELSLEEALYHPLIGKMKVAALLLQVPRLGEKKLNKTLESLHIRPEKEVATLTERQMAQLVDLFPPEKYHRDSRHENRKNPGRSLSMQTKVSQLHKEVSGRSQEENGGRQYDHS